MATGTISTGDLVTFLIYQMQFTEAMEVSPRGRRVPSVLLAVSPSLFPVSPCPPCHVPVSLWPSVHVPVSPWPSVHVPVTPCCVPVPSPPRPCVLCVPTPSWPCPHARSPHTHVLLDTSLSLSPCPHDPMSPCLFLMSPSPPGRILVPVLVSPCPHASSPHPHVLLDTSLSLSPCPHAHSPHPHVLLDASLCLSPCPCTCSPCPHLLLNTSLSLCPPVPMPVPRVPISSWTHPCPSPLCPMLPCVFLMSPRPPGHVPSVSPGPASLLPQHDKGRGLLREDLRVPGPGGAGGNHWDAGTQCPEGPPPA